MLEIKRRHGPFSIKEVWFSKKPYNLIGSDIVFFRNCNEKVVLDNFEISAFTSRVIDLKKSWDVIWNEMDKSSCRWAIKKAERDGVKVKISQDYKKFYKIYCSFIKKKSKQPLSLNYLKKGILFIAELENQLIAGHIYFYDERNIRWMAGPSIRLESDKKMSSTIGNANRLIIWEAMKYAKNKGIEVFDLGGILDGEKLDYNNLFKMNFGGENVTLYNYTKYSSLINFLNKFRNMFKSK